MIDSQIPITITTFHMPLCYNERTFEYSWREHGNLAGHIDYQERLKINNENLKRDSEDLIYALQHPEKFPVINRYTEIVSFLFHYFGVENSVKLSCNLNYFFVTGFSRSGGTYLQAELAKMMDVDIRQEHIYFCHDHFPANSWRAAFNYKNMIEDLHTYYGAILTRADFFNKKQFFMRTILGGLYYPYIENLVLLAPNMNFVWRHIIRDVHGVFWSLKKYFNDADLLKSNEYSGDVSNFETEFGIVSMRWFMCNTSILPTMRGLPFWDIKIDATKSVRKINDDIRSCVDRYIEKNAGANYYRIGKPIIYKFGQGIEEKIKREACRLNAHKENYFPDKFYCRKVAEVDDKYTEMYECLKEKIYHLYRAFDLDYDGI
ncbi:MAG: hypothetical protein KQH63_12285 [Desulfobulbaceae bacterium]|nr:hypothetical protein [Desulfobulbaceae bacterium]